MDVFRAPTSKTRQALLELYVTDPGAMHYLHELKKSLPFSAGNIRRELIALVRLGLFETVRKGRLVYYAIRAESPLFPIARSLTAGGPQGDITHEGMVWARAKTPILLAQEDRYCATRDVFSVRLASMTKRMEQALGSHAYLLCAIAGEIGNNSFDHNLGNWPDIPGAYFAYDLDGRLVVLGDRGQGILKTIRRVRPDITDDTRALVTAFTAVISGRFPERRGNGLKFVARAIRDRGWFLRVESGAARYTIEKNGKALATAATRPVRGCIARIHYSL